MINKNRKSLINVKKKNNKYELCQKFSLLSLTKIIEYEGNKNLVTKI